MNNQLTEKKVITLSLKEYSIKNLTSILKSNQENKVSHTAGEAEGHFKLSSSLATKNACIQNWSYNLIFKICINLIKVEF